MRWDSNGEVKKREKREKCRGEKRRGRDDGISREGWKEKRRGRAIREERGDKNEFLFSSRVE